MHAMAIYLIGTHHGDIKGPQRLECILTELDPNALFVEGSERLYALGAPFKQRCTEMVLNTLREKGHDQEAIDFFIKMIVKDQFYENDTCKKFAREKQKPLIYLDPPEFAEQSIGEMQKHFDAQLRAIPECGPKKEHLSEKGYCKFVDFIYAINEACTQLKIPPEEIEQMLAPYRGHLIGERDRAFEQKIRPMADKDTIAVVVGAYHLVPDRQGQTLFERIKDLQPGRMTLRMADK